MHKRILITGANGRVGQLLQKSLSKDYYLRLADISLCDTTYTSDVHAVDILQPNTLKKLLDGIDCIIHLAAIADEVDDVDKILMTNIMGTKNLLETARKAQVSRFILASSIHAVGFYPRKTTLTRTVTPRPSGFYGVSKVACESLVRLYADKYNISGICLRINSLEEKPQDMRHLVTWLSESDAILLFKAAIDAPLEIHFDIIYGVSNNTQKKLSNDGSFISFKPCDNAEKYRTEIEKFAMKENEIASYFHGGPFAAKDFQGDLNKTLSDKFQDTGQKN